jgi:hypothetical protein
LKTRSAKAKGHTLEKYIRDKLIEKFKLSPDDIRIPVGSETGSDIKLSAKAKAQVPFVFEAKSRGRIAAYGWYKQCEQHRKGEALEPCVVIKMNRAKPLVIIDFEYFLGML